MKTKELIRLLQKMDSSGELDVVVDNAPVILVESIPAYYDGTLQRFEGDYPNIKGASFVRSGFKIRLKSYSIEDALYDTPGIKVDCAGDKRLENLVKEWREDALRVEEEFRSRRT